MKKELLEKIFRQKFECEKAIEKIKNNNVYSDGPEGDKESSRQDGRKQEIGENIIFCDDLLNIIIGDKNE